MFFPGSSSTRKKVDLGGRSSKERDRQVLLEQTRLERKKRLGLRQHNSAAVKIQKCFRGRKSVAQERSKIREQFFNTYGDCIANMDLNCFGPDSAFLRQLLFFFQANNHSDFVILVETCQKLLQFFRDSGTGGLLSIMVAEDYNMNRTVVDYRLKKISYFCIQAVHQNREQLKKQLLLSEEFVSMPTVILLETVVFLANHEFPWGYKIVDNLVKRKVYSMLRDIILTGRDYRKMLGTSRSITSVERIIIAIASCSSKGSRSLTFDPQWSFSSQILSIPFLWHHFPYLKEEITSKELGKCYITQILACIRNHSNVLPGDTSHGFPGFACLVGNLLEIAGVVLSQPFVDYSMAVDFATVTSHLLEMLPPMQILGNKDPILQNMIAVIDENNALLQTKLRKQISDAVDPFLLENLVNSLFKDIMPNILSLDGKVSDRESIAVGAICSFLHATFSILPLERIMTVLAYRTEIVLILWNFIKRCHGNQQWSYFSKLTAHLLGDAPGYLLPLAVFCPVYKHMLMIIDNEEFYEQEKPLPLKDIRSLILILRQVLWELLWLIPSQKGPIADTNKLTVETIKYKVKLDTSELLSQLQDWNNRRPFTSYGDFHALDAVGESFVSQALKENTKAKDVLKLAPFLVPFTSRVKIFTSQLRAARQRDGHHPAFTRFRFKIRRNQIFEDAFNQLRTLSEEDLQGMLRVSFINEVGAEEAGIDGGGIFKDFMESITRAAFDVQYGLFKESTDHLLYPNPGSGLIHEQHLQFFHFLGTILGKAMFEGILVDIPFAMFFLSKLKQKYNYLNDLPSLDPELYRHLLFLKNYIGNVADLELYFVIVNNDYGVQTEEELVPNGRNIRVTKENVITFIHLIANYRLNSQIRHQSLHFLRGFQQLIKKEWIDMFNEHEIQLLISGSLDGMDVDDLRVNAHYSGGYHPDHDVIQMLWDILKNFPSEHQKKFLKDVPETPLHLYDVHFPTSVVGITPTIDLTLQFEPLFVTGCSRGPLLGFKYLEPGFCIQRAGPSDGSEEELDRLPTSATCMNLLKLPPYKSKEQLETKLLYAINADAGFDLS